jgi:tRNA(fMet)-specific endonuclease VapC
MFLIDTNACIRFLNRSSSKLVTRMRDCHPSQILLSSIVKAELVFGAYKSDRTAENLRVLNRFFQPLVSIPFDERCLDSYGRIRSDLVSSGDTIGPHDLLIAATAIAHSLTLVTNNQGEFSRVPGLDLVDWEVRSLTDRQQKRRLDIRLEARRRQ